MGYILEYIIDTRSYDLDTSKAIPGSGDMHSCDFCGKTHEIHCFVYDSKSNDRKVCGSTCLNKHAYDKHNLLKRKAGNEVYMFNYPDEFGRQCWHFLDNYYGEMRLIDSIDGTLTRDAAKTEYVKRWKVVRFAKEEI